ncbi:sulfite exporter TauE/SafE family protein [Streptomyces sp. CB03238]|uniref:sulfite exporter TauE/SafE family protein n=1 Tax=Streptomyces sp. CB03238 TaxID=1907777 RepID=UPI001F4E0EEA|nr:sulfite exporter TauE/SafE family protein [Streptomyces sp. CB03238]
MAGCGIGVVAAIMGVAGGELLIPTIVLLFGEDIKTAGSLSLLVSPPTMLVAFARNSRDGSFAVLGANICFHHDHGRRLHRSAPYSADSSSAYSSTWSSSPCCP